MYRLKFFIFDGLEFLVYSCLVLQPYIGIPFFTAVISIKPVKKLYEGEGGLIVRPARLGFQPLPVRTARAGLTSCPFGG